MSQTFTDFSQLSKGLFKAVEKPVEVKPQPKPSKDGAEALAYFSRPLPNGQKGRAVAFCADPLADRARSLAAELEATWSELADSREAAENAEKRVTELERKLASAQKAHDEIERQNKRLQGECGRLQGELRKCAENTPVAAPSTDAPTAQTEAAKPTRGLLAATGAIAEVFPGEVREQMLASLTDARDAARFACREAIRLPDERSEESCEARSQEAENSGRERRAAILSDVLAANRPSGELDRRRAEVRQIIRDAGSFIDASTLSALGRLGIKCISGRTHWKLEYGGIRFPISKTPSDHRAALNTATDLANRCF